MDITLTSMGTVVGGTAVVSLLLLALKGVFPTLLTDTINRIVALVASLLVVEIAVYATGQGSWQTYLLGFFTGLQVCLAVLNGAATVVKGIVAGANKMAGRK